MTTSNDVGRILRAEDVPAPPPAISERAKEQAVRMRRTRRTLVAVAIVSATAFGGVGVAAGSLLSTSSSSSNASEVLTFQPDPQWNLVVTPLPDVIRNNNQIAWAANVPIKGGDVVDGWSRDTVMSLGPGGVVVFASAAKSVADPQHYNKLDRRPAFDDGYFLSNGYEMQPAPNVSVQMITCRCMGVYLTVQIFFGRNDPTPAELSDAKRQLERLVLPTF